MIDTIVGMANRSRDHVEDLRSLVATQLPDYQVDAVEVLGEGLDNTTYEVNGQLLVRISKEPDPARRAARVRREAHLLAAVAAISPLPVPEPSFTVAERGCLAYPKLPGVPLLDLPQPQRAAHARSIAATLGELLTALHAVPVDRMAALVGTDDQPLTQWRQEAAETFAAIAGRVPVAHRRAVEAFLAVPPPTAGYAPVFSHNDLGIEHVLVDPVAWRATGIIEMSCGCANAPPSMPGAASWRTWSMASRPDRASTSTRA